ncbi:MAG: 50S ribosomal protein L27 [Solitalea-like symbiont of Acarus siro]
MAHKKGAGSTRNGRDSIGRRLGVKISGGSLAKAGNIIVRQVGTKFHSGVGTYLSKNYSIHAKCEGIVYFVKRKGRTYIDILAKEVA